MVPQSFAKYPVQPFRKNTLRSSAVQLKTFTGNQNFQKKFSPFSNYIKNAASLVQQTNLSRQIEKPGII
jgi:hypothetical protein